jgi:UbiD family decarboxylase
MTSMAPNSDEPLQRYRPRSERTSRRYPDLHDHVATLADAGLLYVIDEPVNKDTEIHPLVRWQYRGGVPEEARKAFLFTRPTDGAGRSYKGAVLVAGLAGNQAIYRVGFTPGLENIGAAWRAAIANPIPPQLVDVAVCHDTIIIGDALEIEGSGLDGLPTPISTPGFDNAPYLSGGHYITRDPDTGVQNLGTYRGQIKGRRRLGLNASVDFQQGVYQHWLKYKARGEPMPVAVIVGCPPLISYAAGFKAPDHVDELAVAGALAGAPINVVRAKTVDLFVPAEAEFVIEGFVSTSELEPEGPFGESHGHINLQEYNAFLDVSAITHRRNPILTSIVSQVAPSESSTIRRSAMQPELLDYLQNGIGVRDVRRVHMHEPLSSVLAIFVLQFTRGAPQTEVWRGLNAAAARYRFGGRWIIAVDDDIDPENNDALLWAMAYRSQPQFDLKLVDHKEAGHGPRNLRDDGKLAVVLVNATLKSKFPPVALPKREFMLGAQALWERLGLPPLKPETPWHGYDLGAWTQEYERQAEMATHGKYYELGDELAHRRRGDVDMNTPVDAKEFANPNKVP